MGPKANIHKEVKFWSVDLTKPMQETILAGAEIVEHHTFCL